VAITKTPRSPKKNFDQAMARAIGEIVKAQRQALGLTQRQLADVVGCTDATICLTETGQTIPGGLVIFKLAEALEMTPNDLMGWGRK
jgi:transcriptional regulator with XRE-family HTH domain